jgi:hypothetical protein
VIFADSMRLLFYRQDFNAHLCLFWMYSLLLLRLRYHFAYPMLISYLYLLQRCCTVTHILTEQSERLQKSLSASVCVYYSITTDAWYASWNARHHDKRDTLIGRAPIACFPGGQSTFPANIAHKMPSAHRAKRCKWVRDPYK